MVQGKPYYFFYGYILSFSLFIEKETMFVYPMLFRRTGELREVQNI